MNRHFLFFSALFAIITITGCGLVDETYTFRIHNEDTAYHEVEFAGYALLVNPSTTTEWIEAKVSADDENPLLLVDDEDMGMESFELYKQFTVHIDGNGYRIEEYIEQPDPDAEAVNAEKAALELVFASADTADRVTRNITLPAAKYGTTINWSEQSDFYGLVSLPGNGTIAVTRGLSDRQATLRATITKNNASATKDFMITVRRDTYPEITLDGLKDADWYDSKYVSEFIDPDDSSPTYNITRALITNDSDYLYLAVMISAIGDFDIGFYLDQDSVASGIQLSQANDIIGASILQYDTFHAPDAGFYIRPDTSEYKNHEVLAAKDISGVFTAPDRSAYPDILPAAFYGETSTFAIECRIPLKDLNLAKYDFFHFRLFVLPKSSLRPYDVLGDTASAKEGTYGVSGNGSLFNDANDESLKYYIK